MKKILKQDNLCNDVLVEIFLFLKTSEIINVMNLVCKKWYMLCNNDYIFNNLALRKFRKVYKTKRVIPKKVLENYNAKHIFKSIDNMLLNISVSYIKMFGIYGSNKCKKVTEKYVVKIIKFDEDGIIINFDDCILFSYGNGPTLPLHFYKIKEESMELSHFYGINKCCYDTCNNQTKEEFLIGLNKGEYKERNWCYYIPQINQMAYIFE
jgi:hypothetical protein